MDCFRIGDLSFIRIASLLRGRSEKFAQGFVQERERSLALGRWVAWEFTPADNAVDHSVLDGLCGVEDALLGLDVWCGFADGRASRELRVFGHEI